MRHYNDATALRRALEQRLKKRSSQSGLPLDRLRKEAALHRLLARITVTAPPDSWALKGGLAMLARIGERARATADADATWRTTTSVLQDMLEDAAELDLGDYFEYLIGRPQPIQAEGPEGDCGSRSDVCSQTARSRRCA
ncbi:MAG: nucleotidyl transferase AbiEii/AbiGii toxin family protein [Haloechinothrix sp.]